MIMSRTIHPKDNFIKKLNTFFDHIPFELKNKTLCVCFSGGADSTALLKGLTLLADKYSFSVSACHFNHLIRGDEAYRDEYFCKDFCDSLGIKLYCGRDDVPSFAKLNKLSLEEAARECRYSFFSRIIDKKCVDFCVTAHNMNDDAETLIFNLVRGTGVNGTSAIAPFTENFLRPMLKITRDEILEFIDSYDLKYVTDSTNSNNDYTRNYIRNVVIPNLQKINPSVVTALSKYIDNSREDRSYFENVVRDNYDTDLRILPKSIRTRIIISKFKDFSNKNLNFDLINKIDNAVFSEGRSIIPIYNLYHAVVYNGILAYYNIDATDCITIDNVALNEGINILDNGINIEISSEKIDQTELFNKLYTTQLLSFDNINGELYARSRKTGDRIVIKGINKSLKKLFIDKKVPKECRHMIPIIYDKEGIIYVPFVGVCDRAYPRNSHNTRYITTVLNSIDKERWSTLYEE